MFEFVIKDTGGTDNIEAVIERVEAKYGITFPEVLKEYFLKYDDSEIELCIIRKGAKTYGVEEMVSLNGVGLTFEKIKDGDMEDGYIPEEMFPLAVNGGGDYYYWDCNSEKVSIFLSDNIEKPVEICGSVKEFFELLNEGIQ